MSRHAQPAPLCACAQPAPGPARLHLSRLLLSDEFRPTCSTYRLAGYVPNMAITFVANTFSVTICRLLVAFSSTNWRHTYQLATSPVYKMPYFVSRLGLVGLVECALEFIGRIGLGFVFSCMSSVDMIFKYVCVCICQRQLQTTHN